MEWIKIDLEKMEDQLEPYIDKLVFVAGTRSVGLKLVKYTDMDVWDGNEFEDTYTGDVDYFMPFDMPKHPEEN